MTQSFYKLSSWVHTSTMRPIWPLILSLFSRQY